MDVDFLNQLEQEFTNVGTNECWKRVIGGKTIWFSPVTVSGDDKVREVMMSPDEGTSAVSQAKKVTLSRCIVGINDLDLRPYRKAGPMFPSTDPRVGSVKVELATYLLYKISDWGVDWVNAAFDIYYDLMKSYQKELLKDIKFENAREPKEELAELEDKASLLREQLGLPPKIEMSEKSSEEEPQEDFSQTPSEPSLPKAIEAAFDPFKPVPEAPRSQETQLLSNQAPLPQQRMPMQGVPVAQVPVSTKTAQFAALEKEAHPAMPSVTQDIVESRASTERKPIEINPTSKNVNPRFKPQLR